jgi:hypothetical protein
MFTYNKMNPLVPAFGGLMLCCLSSSVAAFVMSGDDDDDKKKTQLGPTGAGGAGPSAPSYPDHPLHGDKFLVRAVPFVAGDFLPAIIPDPSNENLLMFDQKETKSASSTMVFEPVESKPNTYRLKHKASGKYWSYWNDGLWEWTTTPTTEHDILLEEMSEDNGKMMYRLSKNPSGDSTLYFGYLYDGKAVASFEPERVADGNQLFKVLDA